MSTHNQEADVARLLELVSPKVGIIRNLSKFVRGVEEPCPPFIYQAILSHFDYRLAPHMERAAAGKGRTESDAIRGAIGEAIEHYCAAHFNPQTSFVASWEQLNGKALSPTDCVLYSESQYARRNFPYHRWSEQDQITWMPVRELPSEHEAFAPAVLVYLAMDQLKAEDYLCSPTSNGLAAGPTLEFAVLNGLYELVERDGFLITWMNKMPAPRVDFSAMDGLAAEISEHYARFGTELRIYNLSTDIPIYVMMALALDRTGQGPAALVGLGCHLDPQVALTKAILEICQGHPGEARRFREELKDKSFKDYQDVRTLEDHSAFLMYPERIGEYSFLLENGRTQSIADLQNFSQGNARADLERCVESLVGSGCRVFYADLTTPDVADYGFRVVRTIATGLQPMHFGFGEERLGGRRLFEVPHRMGYAESVRREGDLNPCPHPLA
jgi:ribosomal protein S12 methylthiotransferase accessory factor